LAPTPTPSRRPWQSEGAAALRRLSRHCTSHLLVLTAACGRRLYVPPAAPRQPRRQPRFSRRRVSALSVPRVSSFPVRPGHSRWSLSVPVLPGIFALSAGSIPRAWRRRLPTDASSRSSPTVCCPLAIGHSCSYHYRWGPPRLARGRFFNNWLGTGPGPRRAPGCTAARIRHMALTRGPMHRHQSVANA
jgi:hypothetical protein